MDVAMANPCRLNAQQHLFTFRLGIWVLPRFQRLSPFDDLHRTHDRISSGTQLLFAPPHAFEEGRNESLSHRPLWQRWWYRTAIERGSAARVEGGPHAGPRELAQLPRFDGPQRRWSRTDEDRRSAAVRRRRGGRSNWRRSDSGQNWRSDS